MAKIMTVLGAIAPEELGVTSMHEHILMTGGCWRKMYLDRHPGIKEPVRGDAKVTLSNTGILRRNNMLCDDAQNLDDEEAMCGEVQDFKESGGNTILELSVPGLRGDTEGVRRISKKTGVNVVMATGFYLESSWPEELKAYHTDDYYAYMMNEYENGIDGTDIKPGLLKIGMGGLTKNEEMALRAACRVHHKTGLSMTIHPPSGHGGDARALIKILKEEGMDLSRTVIAHLGGSLFSSDMKYNILHPEDWKLKLDYAKTLMDAGLNISIEFLNQSDMEMEADVNPTDWMKMAGLVALIEQGYANQIVLGTDLCAKPMARRFGGEGYCRLTSFVLPALKNVAGVSSYAIRTIMEENPKRILRV
ncbi:phosphotriesterase [Christensenellaceae bacterium OttesenSCG-928-M15]|nr:phosphotriesterase [Christensenellaceae bacterium OttesenSCG-928-M15]